MKIYLYALDHHTPKLVCTEYEVEEKPKCYQTPGKYYRRFLKEDFNKITGYSHNEVLLTEPDTVKAVQLLKTRIRYELEQLTEQINKKRKELDLLDQYDQ